MSQPTAWVALTGEPVRSSLSTFGQSSCAALRSAQWHPSIPGTTGSVTSGKPKRVSSAATT